MNQTYARNAGDLIVFWGNLNTITMAIGWGNNYRPQLQGRLYIPSTEKLN